MKLIITGALGHIGSGIIHSIKPGQFSEVVLIDNMLTQRYASLFNLPTGVRFRFYEDDICKPDIDRYFLGADVVVHLAAITDATSTFDKKDLVEEVNFYGTKNVASACLKHGCRLIFPSTTSVYGTQSEVIDENCPSSDLKPQSPYAESKLKAEQMLYQMGKNSGLRFVVCRFGTIFGTSIGMRFHTAVNKFVWQACMGKPITVWKTAMNQKRPYLDLEDAIMAVYFIIEHELFDGNIYNIVTINSSVSEIIKIIGKRIKEIKIEYVDSAIMNQLTYTVLNDKFRREGFKFTGNLSSRIDDTIRLLKGIA